MRETGALGGGGGGGGREAGAFGGKLELFFGGGGGELELWGGGEGKLEVFGGKLRGRSRNFKRGGGAAEFLQKWGVQPLIRSNMY